MVLTLGGVRDGVLAIGADEDSTQMVMRDATTNANTTRNTNPWDD